MPDELDGLDVIENNKRLKKEKKELQKLANKRQLNYSLINLGLKIIIPLIVIYLTLIILSALNFFYYLALIVSSLIPFFIAFILAWLIEPIIKYFIKKGFARAPTAIIVYVITMALFVMFLILISSTLFFQIKEFINTIPALAANIQNSLNQFVDFLKSLNLPIDEISIDDNVKKISEALVQKLTDFLNGLLNNSFSYIMFVIKVAFGLLMSLIITLYLVTDFHKVHPILIKAIPSRKRIALTAYLTDLNNLLGRFVKGMLLDSLILGTIATTAFFIVGVNNALLFGLFITLTNMIQYIGPFIGGIPVVIVAFIQDFQLGLIVAFIVIAVQLLESLFLQPLIVGNAIKVNPVVTLGGILLFSALFGFVGALLATPIIILLKITFIHLNKRYKFYE